MGSQAEIDRKIKLKRLQAQISKSLSKLAEDKKYYIEKAKQAKLKGEKSSYALARSGLSNTISQTKRLQEMQLNIEITTQMRDMGLTTHTFLEGIDKIFKGISKLNKNVNLRNSQMQLKKAMVGMENMQTNLDDMLSEAELSFGDIASAQCDVSDKELDALIGGELGVSEELMDEQLDQLAEAAERGAAEKGTAPPVAVAATGESTGNKQAVYSVLPTPEKPKAAAPNPSAGTKTNAPYGAAVPKAAAGTEEAEDLEFLFDAYEYETPPLDLLKDYETDAALRAANEASLAEDAAKAERVLCELKIDAKVSALVVGPTYSRIEMVMPTGVSVNKVDAVIDDVTMSLGKKIRFEIPIPGKNAFGIEVPSAARETVGLKEIVGSDTFGALPAASGIWYGLAIDSERRPVVKDLSRAPHMMIAGSTGSGKSCFLHAMIASLMYKYNPNNLKLLIIDFKRVEMSVYNGSPFLLTEKVVDSDALALIAFRKIAEEMEIRYEKLVATGSRNLSEYNEKAERSNEPLLPRIAVFVDEYADISTSPFTKEFDELIRRLSQKARASGIHLVLATQRPSTDVISGTIKNNFPTQVAFKVGRKEDSRTTLAGSSGAEMLLGNGDLLFNEAGSSGLVRLQAPFIDSDEIESLTQFVLTHSKRL